MPKDRFRSLLKELGRADGPDAVMRLAQDRGTSLLGTPGSASVLVSGATANAEARLTLFTLLLDQARMNVENRGRLGTCFLSEAEEEIAALCGSGGLDLDTGVTLARAYAIAELEAPQALVSALAAGAGAAIEAGGFPEDLDARIDALRREADGDDYMLHGFLNELLSGMPPPLHAAFVHQVSGRDEAWCSPLVLYWLLDPAPEVRHAAAAGLGERAQRGSLDTAAASALPLIRTWVPADDARAALDAALRDARRRELVGPLERPALRPVRLLGSLPDGSGSQTFAVSLEGADGPAAALVLLKIGHGVKDAFVVRGREAEAMLSGQLAQTCDMELAREALEPALSAALAEGLLAGKPGPRGLIDVARACGLGTLKPQPMTARDWLMRVDPAGEIAGLRPRERARLIERSAEWSFHHGLVKTWFEGTAIVDEAVKGVGGGWQAKAALWAALDQRRDYWSLLVARAAHVLNAATGEEDWRSFAATAAALIDGAALHTLPVMEHVLDTSLAAWQAEERALDGWGR